MLRYAPACAPITPTADWIDPLHPDVDDEQEIINGAQLEGLLGIHPSTDFSAVGWEVDEAGDAVLTHKYWPRRTVFYSPFGEDLAVAAATPGDCLSRGLEPSAVNRFEAAAARAATTDWTIKPFTSISDMELSAMTRTVLFRVVGADPYLHSLPELAEAMPDPAPEPVPESSQSGDAMYSNRLSLSRRFLAW
ncbi:hypothetical protein DFJ66_7824 [Saccharothrix variisporea]|uniref:Uncharacterized protein n=2 Tax=Saccharothrix variisporea TaxID=543527 RepID=A0A495XMN4_9PSEU|nr:hypothetical protein DFJ66_7824 [Saccharothrix variisporea]